MDAADLFTKEESNEKPLNVIEKYRKSINPPYKPKDFIALGVTLFLLLAIPLTILVASSPRDNRSQAAVVKSAPTLSSQEKNLVSNEVLVKLKTTAKVKAKDVDPKDTGEESIDEINKKNSVTKFQQLTKVGKPAAEVNKWYTVSLSGISKKLKAKYNQKTGKVESKDASARKLENLIADLKKDPNVLAVEPNYYISLKAVPNDPYYSSTGSWGQGHSDLWGIKKINPQSAWDQTTGSSSIPVAVIDTGVDRSLSDLANNMWVNPGEIGPTTQEGPAPNCTSRSLALDKSCNNLDNDGDGYINDTYGWNFIGNNNNPNDDFGHGTHIAGTIAAVGNNNLGVVGVNWTSKIMALKVFDQNGNSTEASIVSALTYAADKGAKVSNLSWGCYCQSTLIDDALTYEHNAGMVIVAAAGNESWDSLDLTPANSDNTITVSASDSNDNIAYFSNYGEKIDVAAPGVDILSLKSSVNVMCDVTNTVATNYCRESGTSMATPHVAGLAALLLAKNPSLTNEQVRQIIRQGATDLGTSGKDDSFGYGRINASGSMNLAAGNPLAPIITSPSSRTVVTGSNINIVGSIPGGNFSSYKVEIGASRNPSSWTNLINSNSQVINGTLATFNPSLYNDGQYIIRVTATDVNQKTYQFQVNDVTIQNFMAVITDPAYFADQGVLTVSGYAATGNGLTLANYTLDWGVGLTPSSYSTAGISLSNGGTQPVSNGVLGSWDTTGLTPNQDYVLRLTVNATSGASATFLDSLYLYAPPPPPPPPTPVTKSGDLNGDNKIDIYDLSILLSQWTRSGNGDLNQDGKVDIYDLSILLSKWGK